MKPVNEDYKKLYGDKTKKTELEIVNGYVEELKGIPSVECIYVRYDNAGPAGERYIYVETISDGNLESVNELRKQTEAKLKTVPSGKYNYRLFLMDLTRVLKMDGASRSSFLMGLSSAYTDFLYDKNGYFMELRNEAVRKVGVFQARNIHQYETLRTLDTEKQAHVVFQRSLKENK